MNSYLVRQGVLSEVVRCGSALEEPLQWGDEVVVRTPQGLKVGRVLEAIRPRTDRASNTTEPEPAAEHGQILRRMTDQDRAQQSQCTARADADYQAWLDRIRDWKLNLELIDLEWPLEGEQPILYVLTSRGPDATKLTLQAAAAGLPAIHVQPVGPQGAILPEPEKSSGCGSCGCH